MDSDLNNAVFRRSTKVAFRQMDDTFLIVPSSSENIEGEIIYYTLNEVAYNIWMRLDGQKTLQEIGEALFKIYDVDREQLMSDIKDLLSELEDKGVVEPVDFVNRQPNKPDEQNK